MDEIIDKVLKAPPLQRWGGLAAIMVLLSIANFFFMVRPELDTLEQQAVQQRQLDTQLQEKSEIAQNLNERRREMDVLQQKLDEALSELPEAADLDELLGQLNEIGRIDAVMAAVDGNMTLDLDGMVEVLHSLKAPLIIPMHYFSSFTLRRFLDRMRPDFAVESSPIPSVVISKTTLPEKPKVLVLAGDGIGPEIMRQALRVIEFFDRRHLASFEISEGLVGGAALDEAGVPLSDETLAQAVASDAVLFGAFLVWAAADLVSSYARDRRNRVVYPEPNWSATIGAIVVGIALWAVIALWLHFWLFGVSPLGA